MSAHYLIHLADEQGSLLAETQDATGLIDEVLVPHSNRCRGLARHMDPYGKTSFNGMQCEALLDEFAAIQLDALMTDQCAVMKQLNELLRLAKKEVHLHLVFLGD